jgi:multicomponent Na+:H+ antiporter subunit A
MHTSVLILFLLAAVAPVGVRVFGKSAGVIIAAASLGITVWFASRFGIVTAGTPILETMSWAPTLGVDIDFLLDGLSLTFALLICGIGGLVLLYTSSYLGDSPGLGRFYSTLLAFMASMLGLVLADNLIVMFVFWELTSITSFLLIGFDFNRESARRCAWQALVVTGLGGLCLLAGVILLAIASGGESGPEFAIRNLDPASILNSPYATASVVLILIGCFSKSAIVPFHFWLPNAMEAPSPVSALLHSSTMVKAGVYLIARFEPALHEHAYWSDTLVIFGAVTMLLGAILATRHVAFKKLLAYSTVSSLGIMVMLIGLGAYAAAATYLVAHALFKACLFLVAGTATHAAGTKDTEAIAFLGRSMKITRLSAVLGGLSLAGVAPFIGFAGKELAIKAGLHAGGTEAVLLGVATGLAAALTVFAAIQVAFKPFFMAGPHEPEHPHEAPWQEWLGPVILGALGLVLGILPFLGVVPLVDSFTESLSGSAIEESVNLSLGYLLWPLSLPLGISVLAVLVGVGLFMVRSPYRSTLSKTLAWDRFGPERTYDRLVDLTLRSAKLLTNALQNGSLRSYTRIIVLTATACVAMATLRLDAISAYLPSFGVITPFDVMLALTIGASAVSATIIRSRLGAIAALSGVGFAIAVYFVLHGAPDLAGTQFAVETLVVIIFVLVTHRLPRFARYTTNLSRSVDIAIALGLGTVVTTLTLLAMGSTVESPVSDFQAAEAVPSAYGRNVINVILVDYRAIDTLGEIFVLAVAAIGVFTLLTIRPSRSPEASG